MKLNTAFFCAWLPILFIVLSCQYQQPADSTKPVLKVSKNKRILEYQDGTPFFWLGGTTWGMPEWMTREEVDYYLDNRLSKGFNVALICLFWGKRQDDPINFFVNPENAYGHKAFAEVNGNPDPFEPLIVTGGTSMNPNDYWDHVDYIIQAAKERNMIIGLLPVWGRRYVNGIHLPYSQKVFDIHGMKSYGKFLGERLKSYDNVIWVLGGDVTAEGGGDFKGHYRSMAEGIVLGISGETIKWNEASQLWDLALMTYHPDGKPMKNSSQWFHNDPWLDFNMIETHKHRDSVYVAVQQDYVLDNPIKPTVMGEPAYEGEYKPQGNSKGIQMRRQAYQTLFGGACGFTYGAFRDKEGNGPLFSPFKGWEELLDLEGANSMTIVKNFCMKNNWPNWTPAHNVVLESTGNGEFQIVAVKTMDGKLLVYFPDNAEARIDVSDHDQSETIKASWFNTKTGMYSDSFQLDISSSSIEISPPEKWDDAVLIISE